MSNMYVAADLHGAPGLRSPLLIYLFYSFFCIWPSFIYYLFLSSLWMGERGFFIVRYANLFSETLSLPSIFPLL